MLQQILRIVSQMTRSLALTTLEIEIYFGTETSDDAKAFDYGLTAGAGVEFKGVQLGVTYSFGLANISKVKQDDYSTKNRVLGISLGYKIGVK